MTVSIDITEEGTCAEIETPPLALAAPGAATEEERTLLGIRQARDLVLAKNRELIDKLAHAEDQIAELTYQRDDLSVAHDVALKKLSLLGAEAADLHAQVSRLSEERAAMSEVEQVYVLARTEIEADLVTVAQERDAALETIRGHALEIGQLRAELQAAQARSGAADPLADQLEDVTRQLADARDAEERLSAQHEETVARLAGQVAAAERAREETQREVERLVAERNALQQQSAAERAALEARLAALPIATPASTAPNKKAPATHAKSQIGPLSGPPPPIVPGLPPVVAPSKPTPPAPAVPSLSDKELRGAIEAIHHQLEAVKAAPQTPELLAKFDTHLRQLADRSLASGLDLIHHLSSVSSEFISRLQATPARLGPALPALEKTVEMLGWLGLRGRAEMIETRGALVYAVDDDVDNCECIATAFEKIALQTKYSVRPEAALEQIAANPCELIVLDVDLPGMDGFEVHSRIRKMPSRALTPIIFLSGHLSTIERLAALADENTQFVAKPYNLSELSLRALTRIVEARLG